MSDTLRYELDEAPFEGTYVEFSSAWKRREIREWINIGRREELSDEEQQAENRRFAEIAAEKCVAINVGDMTQPSHLADQDAWEELDTRLFAWLMNAIVRLQTDVLQMGEAYGRRLWVSSDTAESQTTDAQDSPQTS